MKMVNKTSFKIAEIIIGLVCSGICAYIGYRFKCNNLLADTFVGFMLPFVLLLPFQINGK